MEFYQHSNGSTEEGNIAQTISQKKLVYSVNLCKIHRSKVVVQVGYDELSVTKTKVLVSKLHHHGEGTNSQGKITGKKVLEYRADPNSGLDVGNMN